MEEHMKTKKIFILPTILEGKSKIVELQGVMGTNETGNKCKICGEAMGNNVITPRLSKYVLSSSHFIYNVRFYGHSYFIIVSYIEKWIT